jgi:hypothetical protein
MISHRGCVEMMAGKLAGRCTAGHRVFADYLGTPVWRKTCWTETLQARPAKTWARRHDLPLTVYWRRGTQGKQKGRFERAMRNRMTGVWERGPIACPSPSVLHAHDASANLVIVMLSSLRFALKQQASHHVLCITRASHPRPRGCQVERAEWSFVGPSASIPSNMPWKKCFTTASSPLDKETATHLGSLEKH